MSQTKKKTKCNRYLYFKWFSHLPASEVVEPWTYITVKFTHKLFQLMTLDETSVDVSENLVVSYR